MNDIENAAHEFAAMYESLFFSFFGTSGTSTNSAEINGRCPIPTYYKTNSNKNPAKALVVNVLAEVQSPLPEVKKTIRSYLSRSKLIDFEKLDDIYTTVRDQRLDTQHIEQYKDEILDIINPQYLAAIHLYMKYHKVYIKELFYAFCGMIITGDKCNSNSDISCYCFAALSIGEELVEAVRECIYGTNGEVTKKPEQLYQEVYSDFFIVANQFPSFEAYKPQMKTFEIAIEEVLDYAKDNWNPSDHKAKNGDFFPATVKQYLDILIEWIRKKVIIKLGTKTGQGKNGDPNLRTVRYNSYRLTHQFKLAIPFDCEKKVANRLKSCPDFLLEELWDCINCYGLRSVNKDKNKDKDKSESENEYLIKSKRIRLMGRLYIIVLLCYAFDSNNHFGQQFRFKEIVDHSLKNEQVGDLLKAYWALTDEKKDKAIIKELFSKRSKS